MRDPASPAPGARGDGANLRGAPLALARSAWIVITVVSLGLLVVAMPLVYQDIITPHNGPQCSDTRFSPAQIGALHASGLSPASFAVWIIAVQCFTTLIFVGVGALIFWRRSENRMALLAATTLAFGGVAGSDPHWLGGACALRTIWPAAALLFSLVGWVGNLLIPVMFYVFPSGRWVPRWSGWLVPVLILSNLPSTLVPAVVGDFLSSHHWVSNPGVGLLLATPVLAQVYRYRRVSTPAERLQTKWVVLGTGIGLGAFAAIISFIGALGPLVGLPATAGPVANLYIGTIFTLCYSLIPISIGIALVRSHLFDVDALINRVLVYGSLTAMLALLYLGGVIALQGLVRTLTGTTQPVLVVITTLAIAALVQPLRRRLQRGIDRRFYRRKYDAARTLAAFSASLRDEVDLSRLRANLLEVVDETMQPRHLSLWLPAAHHAPHTEPAAGPLPQPLP
jgi:hypothetical protein